MKLKGDDVAIDVENGEFSTKVYLHVQSITGSVRQAIRNALWCRQEDKDILMKHIETGDGVALLIDGIDEVVDDTVIGELKAYMEGLTGGCQQVILSARTDLCHLDQDKFDRILVLQGFTIPQAITYVKTYYPSEPESDPTLIYINDHKKELEPILTNPLKLHVLCELTSRGFLVLKPGENFDVLKLFIPLENHLIRREVERRQQQKASAGNEPKVCDEDPERFYCMCLYGMLSGIKAFTTKHLKDFQISEIYRDVFMTKCVRTGLDAQTEVYYSFGHKMFYEVFAASHLQRASEDILKPLILAICRQKSMRNVQKIVCELLSRKELHRENLLLSTLRAIVILQYEQTSGRPIPKEIQNLQRSSWSDSSMEQLLQSHPGEEMIKEANDVWGRINRAFDSNADAELRSTACFKELERNGTIRHLVDCVQSCPTHMQEEIMRHTVHKLLPCDFPLSSR